MKKFCILFILISGFLQGNEASILIEQAEDFYSKGSHEKKIFVRQENFNKSLEKYFEIPASYLNSSPKLNFDIGNLLVQMDETPWGILYLNRASLLDPQNSLIGESLSKAEQKAGVKSKGLPTNSSTFMQNLTVVLFLIGTFLFSLSIWINSTLWRKGGFLFFGVATLSLFIVCYNEYASPVEAVIIEPTFLYKAAGDQYPYATSLPTLAGERVKVLSAAEEGKWLKIVNADGNMGFVPFQTIRIL